MNKNENLKLPPGIQDRIDADQRSIERLAKANTALHGYIRDLIESNRIAHEVNRDLSMRILQITR